MWIVPKISKVIKDMYGNECDLSAFQEKSGKRVRQIKVDESKKRDL
jgi:hypothetical protein